MSRTSRETELTVYARLDDLSELDGVEAAIEDHIQLESTLTTGARIRVRRITPVTGEGGQGERFEITTKEKLEDEGGVPSSDETTEDTDRGFYEHFSRIAQRGVVKRRYSIIGNKPKISGVSEDIVLPPVKYEVDVFTIPKAKEKSNWIKLDIELQDIIKVLTENGIGLEGVKQKFDLSVLAFTLNDMFSPQSATPEQKALLDKLWKEEFAMEINPEIYVKREKQEESLTQGETEEAPDIPAAAAQTEPQQGPTEEVPEGTETETEGEGKPTEEE